MLEIPSSLEPDRNNVLEINFDHVYKYIIQDAVVKANHELEARHQDVTIVCERGLDIQQPGQVVVQLLKRICNADITITDITTFNPNVFLEHGIRESTRARSNILIRHEKTRLPFNISAMRCISYSMELDRVEEAQKQVTAELVSSALSSGTSSDPSFFYDYVHEFSGRALERNLARMFESQPSGESVQEILLASIRRIKKMETGARDVKPLESLLLRLGETLRQDTERALRYYEMLGSETALSIFTRQQVYTVLMKLYGDLDRDPDRKRCAEQLEIIEESLGK